MAQLYNIKCTFTVSVQLVGVKFKSSIPTKIVITKNDRKHSDFHPGMAVLGFELRLSCYICYSRIIC